MHANGLLWPRTPVHWKRDSPAKCKFHAAPSTRLILGLRPANEKRRYKVTPSLIGWAQTQSLHSFYVGSHNTSKPEQSGRYLADDIFDLSFVY